ncbi:unnamed protein product [Chondrus crispus]|uniref:Uncharacterized protein n=1 Tax=Chondrus crispus TaxID=2769 RepID=R7QPK8_CHOCR|nr:unnamed protein product [Chondrus crispus]CDF40422.1 unnamed protein product [Chondrus crispus]|eukprot:XP_005710716.1 unnamed protein product [Chondrus crispus]
MTYATLTVLYVAVGVSLGWTIFISLWTLPFQAVGEWVLLQVTLLVVRRFQRSNWKRTIEDAILDWALMRVYLGWLTITCTFALADNLYFGSAEPGFVLYCVLNPIEAIMFDHYIWGIPIVSLARCLLVIDVLEGRVNRAYIRSLRITTLFGLGWSFYRVAAGHADLRRRSKFDGGIARLVKIFTETCYSASEDEENSRCRTIVAWQAPERRRFGALDAREFITRALSKSWIYDGDAYAASPVTNVYISALIYAVNLIAFGTSGKFVGSFGERVFQFTWNNVMDTVEVVGFTFFLGISVIAIMFPKTTRAHLTYKTILVDSRSVKGWGVMFWGVSAEEINACVEEVGPCQLQLWRSGTGCYMGQGAVGGSNERGVNLCTRKKYLDEKWGEEFSAGLVGEVVADAPGEPVFHVGTGSRRLGEFHDDMLVGGYTCVASDR